MSHLNEEQFIDVLMEETRDPELLSHLDSCGSCQEQMSTLRLGLRGARESMPRMPLMAVPTISYSKFARFNKRRSMMWLAAAAMFLFSILGFRMEIGGNGLVIQFAMFGQTPTTVSSQDDELRALLPETFDLQEVRLQQSMDARFNAFQQESQEMMLNLVHQVNQSFEAQDLQRDDKLIAVQDDLREWFRKQDLKGKLQ